MLSKVPFDNFLIIVLPRLLLYKNCERAKSMYVYFFVPDQGCVRAKFPMDAEQLLRHLGATGRLVGFQYPAYMIGRVVREPNDIQLITKRLYPETARRFHTSASAVERAVRTLVRVIWQKEDHSFFNEVAGIPLTHSPSVSDFIDMSAGFLRRFNAQENTDENVYPSK